MDSGIGLSYRPPRLYRLAVRYDNPMPESSISPSQDYEFGHFFLKIKWRKLIVYSTFWNKQYIETEVTFYKKTCFQILLTFDAERHLVPSGFATVVSGVYSSLDVNL